MTEEKKMLFSQDALKKLLWPLIIEQFWQLQWEWRTR